MWDTRQPDEPVADMAPEDAGNARDCWAVAFGAALANVAPVVLASHLDSYATPNSML